MSLTLSGSGTIGGLVAGGLPDATITSAELASNAVDSQTLTLLNASGSAPVYACRAWVNFNGTGTVAIRASGNVSSITDIGVGTYNVNFTAAMPDTNYIAIGMCTDDSAANRGMNQQGTPGTFQSTSYVRVTAYNVGSGGVDSQGVYVAIFR